MKKINRVKKNEDFSKIIKQRNSQVNSSFIIYTSINNLDYNRYGISVSKKLGNAVIRNKIKRQVRMMIKETCSLKGNQDYVIIVRNNYLNYTFDENKNYLNQIYIKINKRWKAK